jgi:ABC-type multidrug transport system fused ATPase/permease subunit
VKTVPFIHTITLTQSHIHTLTHNPLHTAPFAQITRRAAHVAGLTFGMSELFLFCVRALAFWYGAQLVEDGECTFQNMFTAMLVIIMMGVTLGRVGSKAPDGGNATAAARWLYTILATPVHDKGDGSGPKPPLDSVVAFEKVAFTYPSRADAQVGKGGGIREGEGARRPERRRLRWERGAQMRKEARAPEG